MDIVDSTRTKRDAEMKPRTKPQIDLGASVGAGMTAKSLLRDAEYALHDGKSLKKSVLKERDAPPVLL